jgi:DNA invertase Pin-like site-specific DNA recombinase
MTRAALYARVSTADQTPAPQLDALRAFAAARGWAAQEFVDHGVSGAKERRPALDALMAAARARRVDVVACVKLDRLARSTHHLVTLGRELSALGVDLVVLDQAIVARHEEAREFRPAADSALHRRSGRLPLGLGDTAPVAVALDRDDLGMRER